LLAIAVLFSSTGFACPSFDGNYSCSGDGIDQSLDIQTRSEQGVTIYTVDKTDITADGKPRNLFFMGGFYEVTAACKSASSVSISIKMNGGIGDNDACFQQAWSYVYNTNWTAKGSQIEETHVGLTVCADGRVASEDLRGAMACLKK
jgi:hypothetical protein